MASEKILAQKQAQIADLKEKMENSVAGVLVDYSGITVADDTKLRRELREAGVHYFVVKNTMLERAAEQVGFGDLKQYLSGATALAISTEDQTAAARILSKYAAASKGKFTVKTSLNEKMRRGYLTRGMNTDHFIWNASASWRFLRGKGKLELEVNDILNNSDNFSSTETANQQVSTWSEHMHHFAALSFSYHLDPKEKK